MTLPAYTFEVVSVVIIVGAVAAITVAALLAKQIKKEETMMYLILTSFPTADGSGWDVHVKLHGEDDISDLIAHCELLVQAAHPGKTHRLRSVHHDAMDTGHIIDYRARVEAGADPA